MLIKIKFIQGIDISIVMRRAYKFWLIGLILSIIYSIRNLMNASSEEAILIIKKTRSSNEGGIDEAKSKEISAKLKQMKLTNILNLIKNFGDSITAS